ncbi:MAG: hypothetical protein B7C54_09680 [Acidimicrobiales bacterium mtb01]|nr:hypothetical protein [Actinomycetota bacterium]TEX45356.1 MAG: hypothetical protein B7C54_09680 [Acidimicrobiales bacterium mtb01]
MKKVRRGAAVALVAVSLWGLASCGDDESGSTEITEEQLADLLTQLQASIQAGDVEAVTELVTGNPGLEELVTPKQWEELGVDPIIVPADDGADDSTDQTALTTVAAAASATEAPAAAPQGAGSGGAAPSSPTFTLAPGVSIPSSSLGPNASISIPTLPKSIPTLVIPTVVVGSPAPTIGNAGGGSPSITSIVTKTLPGALEATVRVKEAGLGGQDIVKVECVFTNPVNKSTVQATRITDSSTTESTWVCKSSVMLTSKVSATVTDNAGKTATKSQ